MIRPTRAQASLAILIVLVVVMISVAALVSELSVTSFRNEASSVDADTALLLVDSGLEEAVYRLHLDATYGGSTLSTSQGDVQIVVTEINATTRQVEITTQNTSVQRTLTATVSVTANGNPLAEVAVFSGDDVSLVKSHSMLEGTLWSNDNVNLDESTTVRGDVYTAGAGNGSKTRVQNGGRVEDNPSTTEIEGNVYAIDTLSVTNSGYIENDGVSSKNIQVTSGGYIGNQIIDPSLEVSSIEIPVFNFDTYKSQAQSAGTYYSTPNEFLNYLTLSGNTITGGIHYIGSTSRLTIPTGTYNITGSIISDGIIRVHASDYTHISENNHPALASKRDILFLDPSPCNCTAEVNGVVFASGDIQLKHDQYTGSESYAVEVTGVLWGGDDVTIEDYSKLIFDPDIAGNVQGFNFSGGGTPPPPSIDNIVQVTDWSIE